MNVKSKILGAAMGAVGLVGLSNAAYAVSLTPPIERAGLDVATPLPEGVYFLDIGIVGGDPLDAPHGSSSFNGNVPVIVWSTPWDILGGHIQFLGALPEAEAGYGSSQFNNPLRNGGATNAYVLGMYNEFLAGQIAWNLGNGFSFSYLAGVYLPAPSSTWQAAGVQLFNNTTFHQMAALAYHMNGWNFNANVQYGIVSNTNGANGSNLCIGGVNGGSCQVLWGNYFNYDIALTHTFGKWEAGIIGYGSFDTTNTTINSGLEGSAFCASSYLTSTYGKVGCGKQSQFALGGLVGYNFGPVITQFIIANDVYEQNYGRYNTQAAIHIIVPLWNPEAPKAVAAKY